MRYLLSACVLALVLASAYADEPQATDSITITTYYPSPYGSYNELRAGHLAVGKQYVGSDYCWPPDTCLNKVNDDVDLIVEGKVGIGNIDPGSYKLTVDGLAYSSGGWTNPSDARFKKDIEPISNPLNQLEGIAAVRFSWRKDEFPDQNFSGRRQIGVVAQDVERFFPELVTTDNQGYKALSYDGLTAVLVSAVKEQQREIENLRKEVDKLKRIR